MDFNDADLVDPDDFNRILWKGLMGNQPYPATPTGLDLRENRAELLARYRRSLKKKAAAERREATERDRGDARQSHKNQEGQEIIMALIERRPFTRILMLAGLTAAGRGRADLSVR